MCLGVPGRVIEVTTNELGVPSGKVDFAGVAVRLKARLEGLLASNDKTFREFADLLSPQQQEEAQQVFSEGKAALATDDTAVIQNALDRLGGVSKTLTEVALYDPNAI